MILPSSEHFRMLARWWYRRAARMFYAHFYGVCNTIHREAKDALVCGSLPCWPVDVCVCLFAVFRKYRSKSEYKEREH